MPSMREAVDQKQAKAIERPAGAQYREPAIECRELCTESGADEEGEGRGSASELRGFCLLPAREASKTLQREREQVRNTEESGK